MKDARTIHVALTKEHSRRFRQFCVGIDRPMNQVIRLLIEGLMSGKINLDQLEAESSQREAA